MSRKLAAESTTSDLAIFGRLLKDNKREMSSELARYVLALGFKDAEQARMRQLAQRNEYGELSTVEYDELMSYVKAGHLLALLHSMARRALRKRKVS